jgi:hypothetical protein
MPKNQIECHPIDEPSFGFFSVSDDRAAAV